MRGGAYEYVASYYNGSDADTADIDYGYPFASIGGTSNEYSTTYNSSGSSSASANYKYGDATYETSGWHGDLANFVYSNRPFFTRGGYYGSDDSGTGVFYFNDGNRRQRHQRLVPRQYSSVMCNLLSERHNELLPNYEKE